MSVRMLASPPSTPSPDGDGDGVARLDLMFGKPIQASTGDREAGPPFQPTIVCNSLEGNTGSGQEQWEDHLCFSPGSEVKFTVTFESDKFKVKLPDRHQLTFPNRLGHSHLSSRRAL
ncbi:hypothetical protein QTO34_018003, partial [Cnephaeus nilssonii]